MEALITMVLQLPAQLCFLHHPTILLSLIISLFAALIISLVIASFFYVSSSLSFLSCQRDAKSYLLAIAQSLGASL